MILALKIKNFLSFKEEVTFSFEATKDKSFEDYQIVEIAPNIRISRLAVVYGANASGKTNLIKAFEFLKNFWFNIPESKDESTEAIPFLLDKNTPQEPSELSLIFYVQGIKYSYTLELDKSKVISEKLFIYPGVQPALIFDRKWNEGISQIIFNPKRVKISQAAKDEIIVKCLPNMSVLSAYNQVNVAAPEIDAMVQWVKKQYMDSVRPNTQLINFADKLISENDSIKEYVTNFLHEADYNIANIRMETVTQKVSDKVIPLILKQYDDVPEEEQERLRREKTIRVLMVDFEHKVSNNNGAELYTIPRDLQSRGTMRTFGLVSIIRMASMQNAFLAIDEIESSLHPRLVEFIIEDFFKQKGQSQLLLTTHYDGLLEEDDLLRADSIWFANKKESGSTELYPLTDFKGVSRISSLQKAYKYGKFGATPNI